MNLDGGSGPSFAEVKWGFSFCLASLFPRMTSKKIRFPQIPWCFFLFAELKKTAPGTPISYPQKPMAVSMVNAYWTSMVGIAEVSTLEFSPSFRSSLRRVWRRHSRSCVRRSRGLVAKDWLKVYRRWNLEFFFVFASKDDFLGAV